jgi:hypothetical protein
MKLKIFSIFDTAAQAYNSPFFMHNKAMAIRVFDGNVNTTEENNIAKYPEQFSLFELGEFDDSNGSIQLNDQPTLVCSALELKKPKEDTDLMAEIKSLKTLLATKEG